MNQTLMDASPSWTRLKFLDLRGIKNVIIQNFNNFFFNWNLNFILLF